MPSTPTLVHLNAALAMQFLRLRENSAKTIQELSAELGYSVTTIRSKETNCSTITAQDLLTYATYFDVFPSDLVSMAEQEILKLTKGNL